MLTDAPPSPLVLIWPNVVAIAYISSSAFCGYGWLLRLASASAAFAVVRRLLDLVAADRQMVAMLVRQPV